MDLLEVTGLSPFRTITRAMCLRFSSGCSGVSLMSLFFIAFTRFQSVLEIFEEEDFFILSGPPKRDHVNAFRDFRVRDRNRDTI